MREGLLVGGRYRLESVIGVGGMAVVWRAVDTRLQHVVAAKQIRLPRSRDAEIRQRAAMEAQNASALRDHPHVVAVRDVLEHANHVWLILDYVPSLNLLQLIQKRGRLSSGEVAWIGARIADALAAGHERGILHRDVKPANILISTDGTQVKLSDFGISRRPTDPKLTQSGLIIGTPAYLAPEVARGATPTPAADLYSLGVTLSEALGDQTLPDEEAASGLASVLDRLLNAHPDSRPDAELVFDQLRAVATGPSEATLEALRTYKPERPTLREEPVEKPARRRLIALSIAGVVTVVVLVASGLIVFRGLGGGGNATPPPPSSSSTPPTTSSPISTTATPSLPKSVGTITVSGDPKQADPCSLIDAQTFRRFGETVAYPGFTFAGCEAAISALKGSEPWAYLNVEFDVPAEEPSSARQRRSRANLGGLTVYWFAMSRDAVFERCDSLVILTDTKRVNVSAYRRISGLHGGIDLCELSDVGIDNVVRNLAGAGIRDNTARLTIPLAKVNACDLFERSRNIVPGLDASAQSPRWGFWGCEIGLHQKGKPLVLLSFQTDDPKRFESIRKTIDDYKVIDGQTNVGYYNSASCMVSLEYRNKSSLTALRNETVLIRVESGDTVDKLCAQAIELAKVAARHLRP